MWQEIVEYWSATRTPAQSWSQMAVYAVFCGGSATMGWWLRGQIKGPRK